MLESLSVLIPGSSWVVSKVDFVLFFPGAKHKIGRFDLVMDKVFKVEVLQNGDQLLPKHKSRLLGELATTQFMELVQWSIQFLQYDEVIVLLLPAPVHVRDAHAPLHYLEDFALLQDRQYLVVRPQLILLAFHEHRLLGLCVHPSIEQMLVLPGDLGCEPEPSHQPHFDGSHRNYRIGIIYIK